jgi:hypothetical protein
MYFAERGKILEIAIVRLGALNTRCSVDFATRPSKEHDGVVFKNGVKGTVYFELNQREKMVEVEFYETAGFQGLTMELTLDLTNNINCELGAHLKHARVKTIENKCFPTDRFKADLETLKDPSRRNDLQWMLGKNFPMLIEFCKFGFRKTRNGSLKLLAAGQVENLVWLSRLFILEFLLNDLARGDGSPSDHMLCVYAFGILVPEGLRHYVAYQMHSWGVGGGLRRAVLHNMLASFLYYEEESRETLNLFDWSGTFNHEVDALINNSYMQFFALFSAWGRMLCAVVFIIHVVVTQESFEGQVHAAYLLPFPFLPLVMYLYTCLREHKTERARAEVVEAQIVLQSYVGQAVDHYRTIADYWSRPVVLEKTLKRIGEYNQRLIHVGQRRANDDAFFKWVIKLIEFATILGGGMLASREVIEVGTFSTLFSATSSAAIQF